MTIAVLAVQGAFIEHVTMLHKLGVDCIELRKKADLERHYDGLILPGGESTVQGKLLYELDMFTSLRNQINEGLPVLATCAGLILLADTISNDEITYFRSLPVTVKRNAYGRQLGSFYMEKQIEGVGLFPMKFIRAPFIEAVGDGVEIIAKEGEHTVAVTYKNQIALAFHPELTKDTRVHERFLHLICESNQ